MPLPPSEQAKLGERVNLDEIEPDSQGAPETGDPETPECEDSPTGQHEFDSGDDESSKCVYCGEAKED